MSNLRNKYKKQKPKIADLKAAADAEDKMMGSFNREDYLELEEGKTNKIRFFPSHDGSVFAIMRKRYWIKVPNDEGDLKNRLINDSILHGGTKFDLVQEYVKLASEAIKDAKKLELINHWKDGLKAQVDWVAYALKIAGKEREFGLLNYDRRVRDVLNKITFTEDEDEPIETDPYTDPDDGYPVLITKEKKKKKGSKKETTEFGATLAKKSDTLTDDELEIFEAAKPLKELYRGYTIRDFEKALETLEAFDEHNEIDLFSDDRWEEIVERVRAQYEDEDSDNDDDDDDDKLKKKPAKKDSKTDKKSSKKKPVDDDEDEDEEEEEEKPAKKTSKKKPKPEPEEEDEEEEDEDEEDEDEKPAKKSSKKSPKKSSKKDDDDDDDDEEEEEEDDDDTPKMKGKAKLSISDIKAKLAGKKK